MTASELCELSGRTLLVVEDDDDVVDMLATVLGRYGVHLVRARTLADASAYVDTAPNQFAQLSVTANRHLYTKIAGPPLRHWWGRRLTAR